MNNEMLINEGGINWTWFTRIRIEPDDLNYRRIHMSNILTLGSMKDLSIDEIIRLYQLGYRIEDLAVDPVVNFGNVTVSTGYNAR